MHMVPLNIFGRRLYHVITGILEYECVCVNSGAAVDK